MSGKKELWTGIKMKNLNQINENVPDEFKKISKDFSEKGFITTSSENLISWARTGSLHWMTFGLACCANFKYWLYCIKFLIFSKKARSRKTFGL